MLMRWVLHHPIVSVAAVLLGIGLIVVLIDWFQYFGYYVCNHWTEASWIDEVTTTEPQAGAPAPVADEVRTQVHQ